MKKNVIIISGPTATGKTSTSISLALHLQKHTQTPVSIVNFDSLLFYKEISIGTAKPTPVEMCEIEHKLINICSIKNHIDASKYSQMAQQEIEEILEKGNIVILVGGSGFYLRALIKGMYEGVTTPIVVKAKSEKLYKEEGIRPFIEILQSVDPVSFSSIHRNDIYRIQRAVEYYWSTNRPISSQKLLMEKNGPYDFSKNIHPSWNICHIYLDIPKQQHLQIIKDRAQTMVDNGLISEVSTLLERGFTGLEKPMNSIGYKETIEYLSGKILTKEELVEHIYISTRQLAKSQKTWFKKVFPKFTFNPLQDYSSIVDCVSKFIQEA
ncbi:MAG: tRNA (adenosine(37)-N6)-dimethylallyltransferase MiaA [Bacteriovoracaceae bacterium]|nr:tRNA (adenosine(37)-N6)-dimethylallyltransferase MiaA [Bacteriovoracaceae bacterium]